MLREKVEEAVRSLRAGKSPGVDNIPSELLKNGGEATTTVTIAMYKKIWKTNEWLTAGVDTIARHIFTISLAWALLCLRNLNAVFMQSGPFVVLNSLQLAGCAFNDVR